MWESIKPFLPDTWKKIVGYLCLALAIAAINKAFDLAIPTPQPSFGWVEDKEAVEQVSETLRFKVFSDTPAGQNQLELPSHVYQWEVVREYVPDGPPCLNQNPVGSCVSFGTNNAIYRTMAYNRKVGNTEEGPHLLVEEVTYAGSRVEIGGGRIRGDGSVGSWAATFANKYGFLPRGVYLNGKYDLTTYSPSLCRKWGDAGVPDDLEPLVKEHYVGEITQVKSLESLKKALAQGYGVAVCSGQGFSMTRNAKGIASAQGSWAHCMCIDGYHTEGGEDYFHIENSWGASAHTGPVGWGNPTTAGFWTTGSVVARMISTGGDTWAFSSIKGFPARNPDWFVQANPKRIDTRFAANWRTKRCDTFLLCP